MRALRRLAIAAAVIVISSEPSAVAQQPSASTSDPAREAQATVDAAVPAFRRFMADPNMGDFRRNVGRARGVLIVPTHFKAGFILGGAGGLGVLLSRDGNGLWSQPAFYDLGGPTIGFQIGGQWSEMVLLFMSEHGLRSAMKTKLQLGADLAVAAGPVGIGAQAATADVVAYYRSKGLFGGATIDGTFIAPNEVRNAAYYGEPVTPYDIVFARKVINDGAWELVEAVTHGARPR